MAHSSTPEMDSSSHRLFQLNDPHSIVASCGCPTSRQVPKITGRVEIESTPHTHKFSSSLDPAEIEVSFSTGGRVEDADPAEEDEDEPPICE